MPTPILMPMPGQMMVECTLIAWHKREGDSVSRGDVLFEFETDKSTMEVEAFEDGTLLRVVVPEGSTVPVNTICAWVGAPGDEIPDSATSASAVSVDTAEARTIPIDGPEASRISELPPRAEPAPPSSFVAPAISPRASRIASQLGVSLASVVGSGPEGRIVERDVRATAARTGPGGSSGGRPMSRLRRTIARRLTESVTTAPHFSVTVSVDMTGVLALRNELKERGSSYTVTDFVLWATAQTLAEFPIVNSLTDGERIWDRERVHLGVAVSIPGGLVVPVIRDADRLGIDELRTMAAALVAAARAQRSNPDDLVGGTFTVTNMGMLQVEQFTPIINPGESAILAVASITPTVTVVGGGVGIRQVMRITLAADHRLVDGEIGAGFVNAIRRRLEAADALRILTSER